MLLKRQNHTYVLFLSVYIDSLMLTRLFVLSIIYTVWFGNGFCNKYLRFRRALIYIMIWRTLYVYYLILFPSCLVIYKTIVIFTTLTVLLINFICFTCCTFSRERYQWNNWMKPSLVWLYTYRNIVTSKRRRLTELAFYVNDTYQLSQFNYVTYSLTLNYFK